MGYGEKDVPQNMNRFVIRGYDDAISRKLGLYIKSHYRSHHSEPSNDVKEDV